MTTKLDPFAAPFADEELDGHVARSPYEPGHPASSTWWKIRASQINGCANCLNTHGQKPAGGETEQRIYLLSAWREAPSTATASAPLG